MVPHEAIYKGATRPAMKLGIPLVPLVVLIGLGMLISVWGATLVSAWVVVGVVIAIGPALAWMRFTTRRDDHRFHQLFIALKLGLYDRNHWLWQARSYTPSLYRGASHAWHA